MTARRHAQVMALLGLGTGLLLGRGLELCFGIGQYRLIMAFGGLGGLGIGVMAWMQRLAPPAPRDRWTSLAAGAGAATAVFLIWFLWKVLPLVREEIEFYGA